LENLAFQLMDFGPRGPLAVLGTKSDGLATGAPHQIPHWLQAVVADFVKHAVDGDTDKGPLELDNHVLVSDIMAGEETKASIRNL
jgi:hypothetical protein